MSTEVESAGEHARRVHEGRPETLRRPSGIDMEGDARARRSTSINPDDEAPIDPRMPRLSPP